MFRLLPGFGWGVGGAGRGGGESGRRRRCGLEPVGLPPLRQAQGSEFLRACNIFSVAFPFTIQAQAGPARLGRMQTAHGEVETPAFMPCGTAGTVKSLPQDILEELGAQLILGDTYNLYLRAGHEVIRSLGGLHKIMSWDRA